jgi:hypothetical protein
LTTVPVSPIIISVIPGRSAAWFSASEWGSEGRRFESARPDFSYEIFGRDRQIRE